jgi:Mn-containing catalase
VPWTTAYVDTIGSRPPICGRTSSTSGLINVTDDPGVKDALGFLMTREIAHQKSFEKAL